jgi:hypothetical protein
MKNGGNFILWLFFSSKDTEINGAQEQAQVEYLKGSEPGTLHPYVVLTHQKLGFVQALTLQNKIQFHYSERLQL